MKHVPTYHHCSRLCLNRISVEGARLAGPRQRPHPWQPINGGWKGALPPLIEPSCSNIASCPTRSRNNIRSQPSILLSSKVPCLFSMPDTSSGIARTNLHVHERVLPRGASSLKHNEMVKEQYNQCCNLAPPKPHWIDDLLLEPSAIDDPWNRTMNLVFVHSKPQGS
jgi:hypothetical protein